MGLLDAFLGRKKLPRSETSKLGAISTAELTIRTELDAEPTGQVGLVVSSVAASRFVEVRDEVTKMLELAGKDLGSAIDVSEDRYRYTWMVVSDPDFPDLVAAAQVASQTIVEAGFRDQLLCSVFPFRTSPGAVFHLVYAFKRGSFYAFAPRTGQDRDLALELRIHAVLDRELPLERELEYRYPLWGIPLAT